VAAREHSLQRGAILLGVEEALALAYQPRLTIQRVQKIEDSDNLLNGVWLACLLPIAERRIRNP